MFKSLLRAGTASALVFAATAAIAQDAQTTTETTQTTTTNEPAAPAETRTKVKTTKKTKTPTSTTETTTKTEATAPAAAAPAMDAVAPAAQAAPAPAAPAATAPAATEPTAAAAPAAPNPPVGGAAMEPTKTIVDNASAAPNLTTLVSAVKAADLATTLAGPGPFTVFAPTNDAFGRLKPGTVDTLLKPENKASLQKVLKYHVVAGTVTVADLKAKAAAGPATLTTLEGGTLTVTINKTPQGDAIELTDMNGNKSFVEVGDVRQSNGVVHVVNGVVLPKLG